MKPYPEYLKEVCTMYKKAFHPEKFITRINRDLLIDSRFNIVLEYPPEIVDKIADFSIELNSIIPGTEYTEKNIHATVAVFRGDEINSEIPEKDNDVVQQLRDVVKKSIEALNISDINIYLGKMLLNNKSTILSGYPNEKFWELLDILDRANNNYLRLRPAWGAHITTGRFNSEEKNPAILHEIHKLVDEFDIIRKVSPLKLVITKFKVRPGSYEVIKKYDL